jgi:hypothetical protein
MVALEKKGAIEKKAAGKKVGGSGSPTRRRSEI